ncbi:hypothetical protein [Bradyrhizobium elkanii]|jgi:hypothetical protein|uniref:Uncharacterized protein n=1 Tax=Bradyrhizobium elkanii TaxID=29448 RepID=A0ABV4F294_BRAEL|nr:hypothetical protein [Bradyrhizobium elkanii]QOZ17910.1 hypothetical protein XI02_24950 [Bradyrhizobium sp. CCBAU 21365]WLB13767.1 hypothetical protein QIH87_23250 [Bradyrhizobium elkanii]WLC11889.1 hypothetical protein QIH86_21740 [Bradyrhizobium elkanii USDA 94]
MIEVDQAEKKRKRREPFATVWDEYIGRARQGAESRGLKFEIDARYIEQLFAEQNDRCRISGLPLTADRKVMHPTASLDRIESHRGYEKGNVQWIHKVVNIMKSDHDEEYFIAMCSQIAAHRGNPDGLTSRERAALAGQAQCSKPAKRTSGTHNFKTAPKPVRPPAPDQFASAGGMLF